MQTIPFYIEGSNQTRPPSKRTLYVDGTAGNDFRNGIDFELSHWLPNKTLQRYKAGTSTQICFNYLLSKGRKDYDLVVNNHLDLDGLLSVFVLIYPEIAIKNRQIICDAAATGDFWMWSDGKALELFQKLSLFFQDIRILKMDTHEAYQQCFALILKILQSEIEHTEAHHVLESQSAMVANGDIIREELSPRLVFYHVPQHITGTQAELFLQTPGFNEPVTSRLKFWPQVRNLLDQEKLQLLAVETDIGTYYSLWFPGYTWADTTNLWRPPGLISPKQAGDLQVLNCSFLSEIVDTLNAQEQGPTQWVLFPGLYFSSGKNPKDFPVVLASLDNDNQYKESNTSIEKVKKAFKIMLPT